MTHVEDTKAWDHIEFVARSLRQTAALATDPVSISMLREISRSMEQTTHTHINATSRAMSELAHWIVLLYVAIPMAKLHRDNETVIYRTLVNDVLRQVGSVQVEGDVGGVVLDQTKCIMKALLRTLGSMCSVALGDIASLRGSSDIVAVPRLRELAGSRLFSVAFLGGHRYRSMVAGRGPITSNTLAKIIHHPSINAHVKSSSAALLIASTLCAAIDAHEYSMSVGRPTFANAGVEIKFKSHPFTLHYYPRLSAYGDKYLNIAKLFLPGVTKELKSVYGPYISDYLLLQFGCILRGYVEDGVRSASGLPHSNQNTLRHVRMCLLYAGFKCPSFAQRLYIQSHHTTIPGLKESGLLPRPDPLRASPQLSDMIGEESAETILAVFRRHVTSTGHYRFRDRILGPSVEEYTRMRRMIDGILHNPESLTVAGANLHAGIVYAREASSQIKTINIAKHAFTRFMYDIWSSERISAYIREVWDRVRRVTLEIQSVFDEAIILAHRVNQFRDVGAAQTQMNVWPGLVDITHATPLEAVTAYTAAVERITAAHTVIQSPADRVLTVEHIVKIGLYTVKLEVIERDIKATGDIPGLKWPTWDAHESALQDEGGVVGSGTTHSRIPKGGTLYETLGMGYIIPTFPKAEADINSTIGSVLYDPSQFSDVLPSRDKLEKWAAPGVMITDPVLIGFGDMHTKAIDIKTFYTSLYRASAVTQRRGNIPPDVANSLGRMNLVDTINDNFQLPPDKLIDVSGKDGQWLNFLIYADTPEFGQAAAYVLAADPDSDILFEHDAFLEGYLALRLLHGDELETALEQLDPNRGPRTRTYSLTQTRQVEDEEEEEGEGVDGGDGGGDPPHHPHRPRVYEQIAIIDEVDMVSPTDADVFFNYVIYTCTEIRAASRAPPSDMTLGRNIRMVGHITDKKMTYQEFARRRLLLRYYVDTSFRKWYHIGTNTGIQTRVEYQLILDELHGAGEDVNTDKLADFIFPYPYSYDIASTHRVLLHPGAHDVTIRIPTRAQSHLAEQLVDLALTPMMNQLAAYTDASPRLHDYMSTPPLTIRKAGFDLFTAGSQQQLAGALANTMGGVNQLRVLSAALNKDGAFSGSYATYNGLLKGLGTWVIRAAGIGIGGATAGSSVVDAMGTRGTAVAKSLVAMGQHSPENSVRTSRVNRALLAQHGLVLQSLRTIVQFLSDSLGHITPHSVDAYASLLTLMLGKSYSSPVVRNEMLHIYPISNIMLATALSSHRTHTGDTHPDARSIFTRITSQSTHVDTAAGQGNLLAMFSLFATTPVHAGASVFGSDASRFYHSVVASIFGDFYANPIADPMYDLTPLITDAHSSARLVKMSVAAYSGGSGVRRLARWARAYVMRGGTNKIINRLSTANAPAPVEFRIAGD